jgi:hypothetical protein
MTSDRVASATFAVDLTVGRLHTVAMWRQGAILTANPDQRHYARPIDADAVVAPSDVPAALIKASGAQIHSLSNGDTDGLAVSTLCLNPSLERRRARSYCDPGNRHDSV